MKLIISKRKDDGIIVRVTTFEFYKNYKDKTDEEIVAEVNRINAMDDSTMIHSIIEVDGEEIQDAIKFMLGINEYKRYKTINDMISDVDDINNSIGDLLYNLQDIENSVKDISKDIEKLNKDLTLIEKSKNV